MKERKTQNQLDTIQKGTPSLRRLRGRGFHSLEQADLTEARIKGRDFVKNHNENSSTGPGKKKDALLIGISGSCLQSYLFRRQRSGGSKCKASLDK
jgi:hypothetical protein